MKSSSGGRGGSSRHRRRSAALTVTAAVLGTLSCESGTAPLPPARPASVAVTPLAVELSAVGDTARLSAEVKDQRGWDMPQAVVTWSSADPSVATVDASGLVTAVGNGSTAITASSGSVAGSATAMVAQVPGEVAVSPSLAELTVGDTLRLSAKATDANGHPVAGAEFSWSSSNASVASVDDSGLVTGVSVGEVVVRASLGSASGSASVSVSPPPVPPEPVGTMPDQMLEAEQTVTVDASEYFSDPDNGDLVYAAESSDPAVATTDVSGSEVAVTGVGPGTATVTVTATDPDGLSAEQTFDVVGSGSLEDDFESEASLSDWEAVNADVAIADGALAITNHTETRLGLAKRRGMPALSGWTIQARMGRSTREAGPGVVSLTGHTRFTAIRLVLPALGGDAGDRGRVADEATTRNYEFALFDAEAGEWVLLTNLSGSSESIAGEPGEFTDIEFGHEGGDFVAVAGRAGGTEQLFRVDLADARVDGVPLDEIVSDVTGLWLANQGAMGSTTLHDWMRVTGTGSDAPSPDEATVENAPDDATRSTAVSVPDVSVSVTPAADTLAVGDTLRLSAEARYADGRVVAGAQFSWSSSDPTVATVDDSGLVTGVAVGEVTIRASLDSASGSALVRVTPPPVPPEPVGTVPDQTLDAGQSATVDASEYFNDPDGDEGALSYSAESSDPGVVAIEVSGSRVRIRCLGLGTATVTVTVTDPDGLSASRSFEVVGSGSLEDDFESEASLSDWEAANAEVAVVDGALAITNQTENRLGLAKRREMPAANEWTIQARMGRTTRRARPGVVSLTGHGRFTAVRLVLRTLDDDDGDRGRVADGTATRNYEFAVFDGGAGEWVLLTNLSGYSESISEEPGEFTDIEFGHEEGDFFARAGPSGATEQLFLVDLADARVEEVPLGDIVSDVTGLWLANHGPTGSTALHDRVRVTGTGSYAAPADEAAVEDAGGDATRSTPVSVPDVSVSVTPAAETLAVGDTLRLSAEATDADGRVVAEAEFSWSSSDRTVATVDASGLVTGVAEGAAKITATTDGVSASSQIEVFDPTRPVSVTVSPSFGALTVGETLSLSAEAYDANGNALAVTEFGWSSSDESVAMVNASGLVTGVGEGTAKITAAADRVSGSAEVAVTIPGGGLDRAILVALYSVTDGPNWTNGENWLTDAPLGDWYGVHTDDQGRVTSISLSSNGLTGEIPTVLGYLTSLTRLYLGGNQLTGVIPPELGNLTSLSELSLAGNRLTSPIPPRLGDLANLTVLWLYDNGLTGAIPPELGDLATLSNLSLAGNDLTGAIPPELGRLGTLTSLNLADNDLTEPIPPELGDLGSLERLGLGANSLTGPVPPELGDLANLRELFLNDNGLTGALPESFLNLTLDRFWWSDNAGLCAPDTEAFRTWLTAITRHQPGPFCSDAGTDRAVLVALYNTTGGPNWVNNDNWLTDEPLGKWYGVNTDDTGRVVELDLSGDSDTGRKVPHGLSGSIPPELRWLTSLETLNLGFNELAGPIPPWLGGLSNLRSLSLERSGLTGPIPPELGYLANLEHLILGFEDRAGPIPPELGGLANLTHLSFRSWSATGPIPPELGGLSSLQVLDLGFSGLTGPIPPELGSLSSLWWLNLQFNRLSGPIPPGLGRLSRLSSMNLDHNDLTGAVPTEFGNLSNLGSLMVQSNDLTDQLPAGILNLSLNTFSWGDNAGLCAPDTSAFRAWLATIESHQPGPFCSGSAGPRR